MVTAFTVVEAGADVGAIAAMVVVRAATVVMMGAALVVVVLVVVDDVVVGSSGGGLKDWTITLVFVNRLESSEVLGDDCWLVTILGLLALVAVRLVDVVVDVVLEVVVSTVVTGRLVVVDVVVGRLVVVDVVVVGRLVVVDVVGATFFPTDVGRGFRFNHGGLTGLL